MAALRLAASAALPREHAGPIGGAPKADDALDDRYGREEEEQVGEGRADHDKLGGTGDDVRDHVARLGLRPRFGSANGIRRRVLRRDVEGGHSGGVVGHVAREEREALVAAALAELALCPRKGVRGHVNALRVHLG